MVRRSDEATCSTESGACSVLNATQSTPVACSRHKLAHRTKIAGLEPRSPPGTRRVAASGTAALSAPRPTPWCVRLSRVHRHQLSHRPNPRVCSRWRFAPAGLSSLPLALRAVRRAPARRRSAAACAAVAWRAPACKRSAPRANQFAGLPRRAARAAPSALARLAGEPPGVCRALTPGVACAAAVAQVVQDQAHLGEEAEAEPPDPAVDPPAHGQHHPVRFRQTRGAASKLCSAAARLHRLGFR